jgi:hypothetical protein
MKPLWRWTCGSCSQQGLEILEESVFRTLKILGEENWDWVICHNGLTDKQYDFLQSIVAGRPVALHRQSWDDCPIDDEAWSPIRPDGTVELDGSSCGGTLWKVCPPRMRIESHEVVMDNDLVLLKKLPQIEEFLHSHKTLILEEPVRYYGRFAALIPLEDHINSGLMGFPPGYDFGAKIRQTWESNGRHRRITQEDEQGLLMAVIQSHPNIRIKKEEIRELLAGDPPRIAGDEYGCHFVQGNRTSLHRSWIRYKQIFHETIPFI